MQTKRTSKKAPLAPKAATRAKRHTPIGEPSAFDWGVAWSLLRVLNKVLNSN
jgi:hypothetical protein